MAPANEYLQKMDSKNLFRKKNIRDTNLASNYAQVFMTKKTYRIQVSEGP